MWNPFNNITILQTEGATMGCKFIAMLMVGALIVQTAGVFFWLPNTQLLYYVAAILSVLYILTGGIKIDTRFMIFLLILGVNAFLVPIDPIFNSKVRFAFFAMVMIVCSPLIKTARAIIFRQYVFKYLLLFLCPLVVGSFACFFLGINMMPYNRLVIGEMMTEYLTDYESSGGWFSGLFAHSMVLGPISAFVALLFFIRYQQTPSKFYLFLFLLAAGTTVISSSRAAVLAMVAPIGYMLFISKSESKNKKRIISLLLIGAIISLPIAGRVLQGIINKQEARMEQNDGNLNSRSGKMEIRLKEWTSSPIWGVGFSSVDTMLDSAGIDGQVEPGTSHLAVLSMVGLLGFIAYFSILLYAYKTVKNKPDPRAQFVLALFIAFFFHMWFEGYVFGAGNVLCFLFWLVLSQCFDYRFFERK